LTLRARGEHLVVTALLNIAIMTSRILLL